MGALTVNTTSATVDARFVVWRCNFSAPASLVHSGAVAPANVPAIFNVTMLIAECHGTAITVTPQIASCPPLLPCLVMVANNRLSVGTTHKAPIVSFEGLVGDGVHVVALSNTLSATSAQTASAIGFAAGMLSGSVNITIANNSVASLASVFGLQFGTTVTPSTGSVEVWGNALSGPMLLSAGGGLLHMNVVGNIAASYSTSGLVAPPTTASLRVFACNTGTHSLPSLAEAGFSTVQCNATPVSFVHRCPLPQPPAIDAHADDGSFLEHWPVTAPFALCAATAHQYTSAVQAGGAASAIARSSFLIDTAAAVEEDNHAVVLHRQQASAFRSLFLMGAEAVDERAVGVAAAGSVVLRCVGESVGTAADWSLITAVASGMPSFSMFDFSPSPRVGRLACLSGPPTATQTPTIVVKSLTRAAGQGPLTPSISSPSTLTLNATLSLHRLPSATLQPNATSSFIRLPSASATRNGAPQRCCCSIRQQNPNAC